MDRLTLKRSGQVLAPSLFTMGNMACGFYSLLASSRGDFTAAATAILGGVVCDMLDGRVARMVHGESSFGVEFDSLSDFLTFGVAPASMVYAFILKDYGVIGGLSAFLFALCGGLRLALFNVSSQSGSGSKTHFQGLPIPAGAGFWASFILLYQILEEQKPARTLAPLMREVPFLLTLVPFLMVGLAFLMVSTIPYAAFKQKEMFRVQNPRLLGLVALGLALVYFYPQNAIFLLVLIYVLSGFFGILSGSRKD
ncbi:MAG: CDP-diacylglycerol--serine O-phosphatidyltransferase [Elusimicrobia bacterium]|nr:CDP-diacylglycerol--serine O-phosphatidyltransferase [Elusimicrobiota bacterium]